MTLSETEAEFPCGYITSMTTSDMAAFDVVIVIVIVVVCVHAYVCACMCVHECGVCVPG